MRRKSILLFTDFISPYERFFLVKYRHNANEGKAAKARDNRVGE